MSKEDQAQYIDKSVDALWEKIDEMDSHINHIVMQNRSHQKQIKSHQKQISSLVDLVQFQRGIIAGLERVVRKEPRS